MKMEFYKMTTLKIYILDQKQKQTSLMQKKKELDGFTYDDYTITEKT